MDVNKHEAVTVELKALDGKSGRWAKKAGRYVLHLIFLYFSFVFSCSFTNYIHLL